MLLSTRLERRSLLDSPDVGLKQRPKLLNNNSDTNFLPSTDNAVSSSYWKLPDNKDYLTAVASHETEPFVAVASANTESNLFIYEVGDTYHGGKQGSLKSEKTILTHHQTITLPGIHSLAWASPTHSLGGFGNVLASGHNSGLVHLTLLPDAHSESDEPAEILRRYNHSKHIAPAAILEIPNTRIKNLNIVNPNWKCCVDSSIMTLYNEHLFLWDPARSDVPALKKRTRSIFTAEPSPLRDGIISLGGHHGISITDIRVKDSSALSPPQENDKNVSLVRWSPDDENIIAAVHESTTIKLWDIRAGKPMVTLLGHSDKVNSIVWSPIDKSSKFHSASSDGTIRMWNIENCMEWQQHQIKEVVVPLKINPKSSNNSLSSTDSIPSTPPALLMLPQSPESQWFPKPWQQRFRQQLTTYDDIFSHASYYLDPNRHKPSYASVFSNRRQFLGLAALRLPYEQYPKLTSIDNDGFFGVHSKLLSRNRSMSRQSTISDGFSESSASYDDQRDDLFSSADSSSENSSPRI